MTSPSSRNDHLVRSSFWNALTCRLRHGKIICNCMDWRRWTISKPDERSWTYLGYPIMNGVGMIGIDGFALAFLFNIVQNVTNQSFRNSFEHIRVLFKLMQQFPIRSHSSEGGVAREQGMRAANSQRDQPFLLHLQAEPRWFPHAELWILCLSQSEMMDSE